MRRALATALALAAMAPAGADAAAPALRAGVGRADVTPQLGYYLGGWTRQDRTAQGQHTRLFASAMTLQRGDRKLALVSIDLFMVPGGLVRHVGEALADRGYSEQNLVINASHTHSGPGGFGNSPTLNTAAPSLETATDPFSFAALLDPAPADRQLYTFLVNQIATAVRRADDDMAPAALGWGSASITGLTRNRSLEAHLANHGVIKARGDGRVEDDPAGALHTIDQEVDVMRVDKIVRRKIGRKRRRVRVPIGGWSMYGNHGTVTKSSFEYYNQDHHGSALRVFEAGVRKAGKVPKRQLVLNVYGNGNEGDMSAGLDRTGPAGSDEVGRVEAAAMLRAWRLAGRAGLSRRPQLDLRWTRVCFCGQMTETGPLPTDPLPGMPFLTGSEEERGPLFDVTGEELEDRRNPVGSDTQGHKIGIAGAGQDLPRVVPIVAVRARDRLIVTIPGEPTVEIGRRVRAKVEQATAGAGIKRVVISGLTNEFILYVTTHEEYERQHYEGGNTHYGPNEGTFFAEELGKLAGVLVRGEPAPPPADFDPTFGVVPDGAPYGTGAASGSIVRQPAGTVPRLTEAEFGWQGGPLGLDRPVDRAFVRAQRKFGRRWRTMDSDLGLAMLWTVDANGLHSLRWEVPLSIRRGRYRFVVTAKRYRLVSKPFRVVPGAFTLDQVPSGVGRLGVKLQYPAAVENQDLTWRPGASSGGTLRARAGRRFVRRRTKRGAVTLRAGSGIGVAIPSGGFRDRFGNKNAAAATLFVP